MSDNKKDIYEGFKQNKLLTFKIVKSRDFCIFLNLETF